MSDWYIPPKGVNEEEEEEDAERARATENRKREGEDDDERRGTTTSSSSRRRARQKVYQIWPGNDKFFWDGRIIVGPNYKAFLNTIFLVLVPSITFTSAVAPRLSREYSWAWQLVSVVWPVYVLGCLIRTGTMDPGILPRLPRPPPRDRNDPPRERTRDVPHEPTKKLVTVKWNDTTNFFQPPRAHHCSINNDCVEKFDHHCPWVGTTIGRRNYRHFLLFVFGTTLWCGFVVGSCVMSILVEIDERNDAVDPETGKSVNTNAVAGALRASGAALFCGIIALFGFMFVFALSAFHVYLICQNQTTYENFRERGEEENPYTRGNWCKNCFEIFFEPIPPSWFDFRRYADEDDSADRFAEHMRQRGLLLQEQDPEIARKETEKRLAEFTEDLEKAKEKIAYKQNLELSEQAAMLEEEKNREEEGIAMKMKNALANVFGNGSTGAKEKRGDDVDDEQVRNGEDGDDYHHDEELGGFESPIVFDENYVPDILRQQQSSDEDGGSEASVSSRASSDMDERKRRFQQEKGRGRFGTGGSSDDRESEDDDEEEHVDDTAAEKEELKKHDDNDEDYGSSSLSDEDDENDPSRKPNDERDTEADNEVRSDTSSEDDLSSSSYSSSLSSKYSNSDSDRNGSGSLIIGEGGGGGDDDGSYYSSDT